MSTGAVGWCCDCNVPVLDAGTCGICSSESEVLLTKGELKPVFPYEKKFYNEIIDKSLGIHDDLLPQGLCFMSSRSIIVDGLKVFRIFLQKLQWKARSYGDYRSFDLRGSGLKKVIQANKQILKEKEEEAILFLRDTFRKHRIPAVVSFSGGKDSACALFLTRKVRRNIPVLYLNTTLDFPQTVNYVHTLESQYKLNLTEIFPEHDFLELCTKLGPPSVFMPWCCRTQKFAPFNKYLNEHFPNGVLSVEGLRRFESNRRKDYKRVSANPAIPRKKTVCPILDWTSLDVWLYTLWKKIPINQMYEYGFNRMGCWACPHRGLSHFKLSERTHPELMKVWYRFLLNYARNNGKDKEWVYQGKWRIRRTAYVKIPCHTKRPCGTDNSMVYEIESNEVLTRINQFMKIFGEVKGGKPDESRIQLIKGDGIEISIIGRRLRMSFENPQMLQKFEKQLSKAINCIACGSCVGVCNSLRVVNRVLTVDEEKCTHCLRCTTGKYIRMGCVALNYKKERYVWHVAS